MSKKVRIYIDMDNVLCDYQSAHTKALEEQPEIAYPQSQYGFFANLKPIENAIHAFQTLSYYFDVWILTAPSIQNPMCYTEKRVWVEKYLGYAAAEKLILSPDKSLLRGDFLIDDLDKGRAKQNKFQGKLIKFGSKKYPNWSMTTRFFIDEYKL